MIRIPWKWRPGYIEVPDTEIRPQDQIFNHKDNTGVWRSFHVPTLRDTISTDPPELIEVELKAVEVAHIRQAHGVEATRLSLISADELARPGVICRFKDGTDILVDGNHRFVARYGRGLLTMNFWRLTEARCRPAMLSIPLKVLERSL